MDGSVPFWLYLILALNFGVSWLNARTCGRAWVESKAAGGLVRVLVWCGARKKLLPLLSVLA